jgi:hypothetical protein
MIVHEEEASEPLLISARTYKQAKQLAKEKVQRSPLRRVWKDPRDTFTYYAHSCEEVDIDEASDARASDQEAGKANG